MRFLLEVALLLGAGRVALTQRPANASICDYYAMNRYGANTSDTQFSLIEHIVALAFGGGASLPDAPSDSTGVLNPGTFQGQSVNLRSWFDGSKATTNINNQPASVNWLDAGAQEPLTAFLSGDTDSVIIANLTNEYRLFTHFYTAFGFIFGCTLVRTFPRTNESGGPISLAYIHKYMQLNQTHLGHFIDQVMTSSKYFGFSEADTDTLSTFMNARYNVRCAPPVNGQLYSLCQAQECPLAAPSPDCNAYINLGPGGNSTGPAQTGGSSPSSTSTASTSSTTTSSASPLASTSSDSGSQLSPGAIAGVSIGGAAILLIALGLFLFFRRRPAKPQLIAVPYSAEGYASPSQPSYIATNPHTSFAASGPHDSWMAPGVGQGYSVPKPPDEAEHGSALGPGGYNIGQRASPTPQSPPMAQIHEMESPHGPELRNSMPPIASVEHANTWEPANR